MDSKIKVVLTGNESGYSNRCAEYLRKEGLSVTLIKKDGFSVLDYIKTNDTDVLIIDAFMKNLDAAGVLIEMKKMSKRELPYVFVMSAVDNEHLEQIVLDNGAGYFMLKPFDFDVLLRRIRKVNIKKDPRITTDKQVEIEVSRIMRDMGIPANIKGYGYIRESVMLSVGEPSLMQAVTTKLYPMIAKRNETTPSRVERAVRHAIETAWENGNDEVMMHFFNKTKNGSGKKPTNSEFIARLSDTIRLGEADF